jgi:hypothetical protein
MRTTRYAACLLGATLAFAGCAGQEGGQSAATTSRDGSPTSTSATRSAGSTTTTSTTTTRPPTKATPKPTPSTRHTAVAPRTQAQGADRLAPVPAQGPQPTVRFPDNEAASGAGANAGISSVPDALWNRMVGYSWTRGCPVGRSQLRQVRVNFWGFDGKRSRGTVVVNASIAARAAAAFTALYEQKFRIRQMRPMDSRWGHNPKGPGADDYAAMRADNTSAFNCRYVGGQEASKVYSKHAYGTAIDVNDFENPYVADNGTVYPGTYWLHRRGPAPGVFSSSGSAAVRAFTSQGLSWGGLWANPDFQHFQR